MFLITVDKMGKKVNSSSHCTKDEIFTGFYLTVSRQILLVLRCLYCQQLGKFWHVNQEKFWKFLIQSSDDFRRQFSFRRQFLYLSIIISWLHKSVFDKIPYHPSDKCLNNIKLNPIKENLWKKIVRLVIVTSQGEHFISNSILSSIIKCFIRQDPQSR